MKTFKPHNTPYDPKVEYPNPFEKEGWSQAQYQDTLHSIMEDLRKAEQIKDAYSGCYQWTSKDFYLKPGGYPGCYGSAMTNAWGGKNVFFYGDFFVNWDDKNKIGYNNYFEYLVDEKYSPFRTFIKDKLLTCYVDGKLKGYIVKDTKDTYAAPIGALGLAHRAMSSGERGYLWVKLLDEGFDRIEAFFLSHFICWKPQGVITKYSYSSCLNLWHQQINLVRLFKKEPILHKAKNLDRKIFPAKGFNPCNSMWDDVGDNSDLRRSSKLIADLHTVLNTKLKRTTPEVDPNNSFRYLPVPPITPEEAEKLNAEILASFKELLRAFRKEIKDAALAPAA